MPAPSRAARRAPRQRAQRRARRRPPAHMGTSHQPPARGQISRRRSLKRIPGWLGNRDPMRWVALVPRGARMPAAHSSRMARWCQGDPCWHRGTSPLAASRGQQAPGLRRQCQGLPWQLVTPLGLPAWRAIAAGSRGAGKARGRDQLAAQQVEPVTTINPGVRSEPGLWWNLSRTRCHPALPGPERPRLGETVPGSQMVLKIWAVPQVQRIPGI